MTSKKPGLCQPAIIWLAVAGLFLVVSPVHSQQVGPNYHLRDQQQQQQEQHQQRQLHHQQQSDSLVASFPRSALEKMANLTQEDSLWILIPSNLTGTQMLDSDFSLFKLNTGQLGADESASSVWSAAGLVHDQMQQQPSLGREAKKLGLFSNVLNKPKVSPLYLVNGTVCRFVNSQPICTTLSTTGLIRNQPVQFMQGQNGLLDNNNNQMQQGLNQLPNQRQVSPPVQQQGFMQQGPQFQPNNQQFQPNNQQFQPNNQFNQQFRPSAIMDDETRDVSLANRSAVASAPTAAANRPLATSQNNHVVARPVTHEANRRPLSLLTWTRPFRSG